MAIGLMVPLVFLILLAVAFFFDWRVGAALLLLALAGAGWLYFRVGPASAPVGPVGVTEAKPAAEPGPSGAESPGIEPAAPLAASEGS